MIQKKRCGQKRERETMMAENEVNKNVVIILYNGNSNERRIVTLTSFIFDLIYWEISLSFSFQQNIFFIHKSLLLKTSKVFRTKEKEGLKHSF